MANYRFSADLLNDVLFRAGEPSGSADFRARALTHLNRAYQAVWTGGAEVDPSVNEEWWWLQREAALILPAAIEGSASVTKGSASITFSAAPASLLQGWHIRFSGRSTVYKVETHAGGTSATLDEAYVEDTASNINFTAFKLEMDLAADILDGKVLSPMQAHRNHPHGSEITGVPISALQRNWPLHQVSAGVPSEYAQVSETRVRFNRYVGAGEKSLRVDYWYFFKPADLTDSTTEEPALPFAYRRLLADIATYWLMLDKQDDRADAAMLAAKALLKSMQREHRHRLVTTGRLGHIYPRSARRSERGLLRTESGSIIG